MWAGGVAEAPSPGGLPGPNAGLAVAELVHIHPVHIRLISMALVRGFVFRGTAVADRVR